MNYYIIETDKMNPYQIFKVKVKDEDDFLKITGIKSLGKARVFMELILILKKIKSIYSRLKTAKAVA